MRRRDPCPWIRKSTKKRGKRERKNMTTGPAKPRPITKCRDKSHTSQGGCELISTSESGIGEEKVRGVKWELAGKRREQVSTRMKEPRSVFAENV